jgi:large subunit ribosomal protein L10
LEKSQKVKAVEDLQEKLKRANATFIAEYQGIKAVEMNEMRKALRDASIDFKVMRNTLSRRAFKGTPVEAVSEHFKGPVAVALSYKDAAAAAKALTQFAKDKPNLKIRVGTLGAKVISLNEIKGLAELPPKEVLIAKLLGTMKAPVSGIVGVLAGVPRKFLYALNAIKDQKAASAQ